MKKGLFISFEGNDGSGKTTVCENIKKKLEEKGKSVVLTREPGGSVIAEKIRDILLDKENSDMDPGTEALLYAASRRQHLVQIIKPALAEGKIVLCDRFVDSSLAYQGHARGLGLASVWDINQFAIDGLMPDKTIFLSVSVETGKKRMNIRGEKDRMDSESDLFHQRVREGYDIVNSMFPHRIVVISAEEDIDTVTEAVWKEIEKVIYE